MLLKIHSLSEIFPYTIMLADRRAAVKAKMLTDQVENPRSDHMWKEKKGN